MLLAAHFNAGAFERTFALVQFQLALANDCLLSMPASTVCLAASGQRPALLAVLRQPRLSFGFEHPGSFFQSGFPRLQGRFVLGEFVPPRGLASLFRGIPPGLLIAGFPFGFPLRQNRFPLLQGEGELFQRGHCLFSRGQLASQLIQLSHLACEGPRAAFQFSLPFAEPEPCGPLLIITFGGPRIEPRFPEGQAMLSGPEVVTDFSRLPVQLVRPVNGRYAGSGQQGLSGHCGRFSAPLDAGRMSRVKPRCQPVSSRFVVRLRIIGHQDTPYSYCPAIAGQMPIQSAKITSCSSSARYDR
jgi:hypothetical protein